LEGLKENVIVGRLIPAGTGAVMNRLKAIAAQRDRDFQAQQAAPAIDQSAPESNAADD